MQDEDLKFEEIETSHTLGGSRRCRCYSDVRYTIVNRTENVDPPDMKLGGLGSVFQVTRSRGQISNSPERSILPLGYTCISFNSLQTDQSCIISFSIRNKSQKAINVSSSRDISFVSIFLFLKDPLYLPRDRHTTPIPKYVLHSPTLDPTCPPSQDSQPQKTWNLLV